mmetsp:Transcript_2953/g.9866  ORF Transcript_2953/g.9866 Transcript_2953/m.9866 type:complete len:304 (+) Transcript_2953:485-1396(+)
MLFQVAWALVGQRIRELVRKFRDLEAIVGDGEVDVVRGPEVGHRFFRSHLARARSDVEDALDEDRTVAALLPDDDNHRKNSSGAATFIDLDANDAAEILPRRHQLVNVLRELQRITVRQLDLDHDVRLGIVAHCNSKDDVGIGSFLREDLVVVEVHRVHFPMAAAGPEFGSKFGVHDVGIICELCSESRRRSLVAFVRHFTNVRVPRLAVGIQHQHDTTGSDFRKGVRVLDPLKEHHVVVAVFVELLRRALIIPEELLPFLPFFRIFHRLVHRHGCFEKLRRSRGGAVDRTLYRRRGRRRSHS